MADSQPKRSTTTQRQRRFKYGLNVLIAVAAAVLIVVILNTIAYKRLFVVRWDLTATRQYSLSAQTRQLLRDLDHDYRIVTLLGANNPHIQQARGLIGEYARYSSRITVEHIDPARDIARIDRLHQDLRSRYDEELAQVAQAVTDGNSALARLHGQVAHQLEMLRPLLEENAIPDTRLREFVQSLAQTLARFDRQYQELESQLAGAVAGALPNYDGSLQTLRSLLGDYDEKVFAVAVDRLNQAAGRDLPGALRESLLKLVEAFEASRTSLAGDLRKLRDVSVPPGYVQLRDQLSTPDAVVLVGAEQVQVIRLDEMFRQATSVQQTQSGQQPEVRFLGEERITGALVSMEMKTMPMVVFVNGSQRPATGPQGEYAHVAQRLTHMNFQVEEWQPGQQPNPMTGQMMPSGPPPVPQAGQPVVWVVLPGDPPSPMMPMADTGQEIAEHLALRLEQGDAALFMLMANPAVQFGAPDPVAELVEDFGVVPRSDRVVMRREMGPNRQVHANRQLQIDRWPDSLPVTEALAGMAGVFLQAIPLELQTRDGVTHYPLVEITGQGLWATRDFLSQNPQPADDEAVSQAVIASALSRDGQRLVVVGDPVWASDMIATYGLFGPGTAEIVGAAFPGNAELFVNSVYWLSGLDQLIAAGARTQDIRRIEAMESQQLLALRWGLLGGMPLAACLMGVGVWMVRRRG